MFFPNAICYTFKGIYRNNYDNYRWGSAKYILGCIQMMIYGMRIIIKRDSRNLTYAMKFVIGVNPDELVINLNKVFLA